MKRFPRKRVFITGGGSGFGRGLAIAFADIGWKVCVGDINTKSCEETIELVRCHGGEGFSIKCDVTKLEDYEAVTEELNRKWQGVDIVINNAGVAAAGYMEDIPIDKWNWIIDINLKGVIYGCKAFIPVLKAQGGGHLVNVASNAGITCLPEMSSYNVTKAGVIALSETLRGELYPKNIGVTVVAPTFFKTNLMDNFTSTDPRQEKMASAFFGKSSVTTEDVVRHTIRSIRKNKLYVITQKDGKFTWFTKRLAPEIYFNVLKRVYKLGIMDKFLGI